MAVRIYPRAFSLALLLFIVFGTPTIFLTRAAAQAAQPGNSPGAAVSGQTINAVTGQPVSRVLVRYGLQAVLTDYQGMFHFDTDVAGSSLTVSKPGYSLGEDAGDAGPVVTQATTSSAPLQVRLYPEAILAGILRSSEGDPLPGITVIADRSRFDESGHHWVQVGQARADSHGEFRLPVLAGDYRLQTVYAAPSTVRREAITPVEFPDGSSTSALSSLHLNAGETRRVELSPAIVPVSEVTARVEPEAGRGNIRLTARIANGASFLVRHTSTGAPGELRMDLPQGNYVLEASRQTPEGLEHGHARMAVGATAMTGVLIQLSSVSMIPIEIAGDSTATYDNKLPSASQLGLSLENTDLSSDTDEGLLRVVQRSGQSAFFNPPPGTYRLHAQSGAPWFVVSATYGENDLLRQNLTVSPGAGAAPVRIVVSDRTANLAGTVRLSGQPAPAWVYLMASAPSATPVVIVHAGVDGRYNRAALPPGSYRALAFEHRHSINFEDPGTLANFTTALRPVTIEAGDKATLDLEITPYAEFGQ